MLQGARRYAKGQAVGEGGHGVALADHGLAACQSRRDDSLDVLNSVCDVFMAAIGFVMAKYSKIWLTVTLIVVMELGCLFWIRDNLTLNIVMLVHPVESLKIWQSEGH